MTGSTSLKDYQKAPWSAGTYNSVAGSTVIASELLLEAVEVLPGHRVLDAACGSGNATVGAARRFADVVGLEQLPFPDDHFDVVLSAFGAMFASDQRRTGAELLRVCKPDGRVGLASWTAGGALGRLFDIAARYLPPTPGVPSRSSPTWLPAR
ncbi:class I SAM-dependent methyltransferase [Micromonospora endophytica]|uniref:Uncharacterized protein n=1 Tax=Micromonospora endophytica TaxID=515350 RepID=A0A2W2CMZ5_9ACTN|nr:class I SAM-dependent methyltransferase [Micromonospora endophytica]PZG00912.1 hypothetical protein C1I93_01175 [Micromonospora endophytica]RIW46251.1 methyltransferase domain-containing protein [Micromonospora endophytica]BCJ61769.1 hypothetical protein Jiend_51910 [Micromonospora endophytica]